MNLKLSDVQWELLAPIILLNIILVVVALIDCSKRSTVKGSKWMWVLLIIFVSFIGPISYFIFGRRNH